MKCQHGIFKIIELIFVFTIVFLARFGYKSHTIFFGLSDDEVIFGYIVYALYLIYIPAFILGQLLGDSNRPPWRTDTIFSLVGCIVFLSIGTKVIQTHLVDYPEEYGRTRGGGQVLENFQELLDVLDRNNIIKGSRFDLEREESGWRTFITSRFSFIQGGIALGALSIITGAIFFLDMLTLCCRIYSKKSSGRDVVLTMKFNLHNKREKHVKAHSSHSSRPDLLPEIGSSSVHGSQLIDYRLAGQEYRKPSEKSSKDDQYATISRIGKKYKYPVVEGNETQTYYNTWTSTPSSKARRNRHGSSPGPLYSTPNRRGSTVAPQSQYEESSPSQSRYRESSPPSRELAPVRVHYSTPAPIRNHYVNQGYQHHHSDDEEFHYFG